MTVGKYEFEGPYTNTDSMQDAPRVYIIVDSINDRYNNRTANSEPDNDTIKFQVGNFRQAVGEILKNLDGSGAPESTKKSAANVKEIENSPVKLFEEIKIMFQDLPSRIERANLSEGRRRKRRYHPGMLEEMMHFSKNPKIGLKMALSLYREKMPWIYDEGIVLIGKLEASKTPSTTKRVLHEFEELLRAIHSSKNSSSKTRKNFFFSWSYREPFWES